MVRGSKESYTRSTGFTDRGTSRSAALGALIRQVGILAAECWRVVWDHFDRSSPVARTIDDLDAPTLGRLLGTTVERVEVRDRSHGTTDRARLGLTGEVDALPSIFVKLAPTAPVVRVFTNLARLGDVELGFYRDIRPGLSIEAPQAVALDSDARTKRFAIILEDLNERGVRFGDASTGLDPDSVGALVETLAGLHGALWASPRLQRGSGGDLGWVIANSEDPQLPLIQRLMTMTLKRLARRDPELVPAVGERIIRRYSTVAAELDLGPHTVLHGDPHPGNTYFTGEGAGLLDWQALRKGNAIRDVTYSLVFGLDPEDRRRCTEGLLDRYRDALASAGGPVLDPDGLWLDHRRCAAYAYVAAAFTAGFGGLQTEGIALQGVRRAIAALDDLDTGTALATLG